MTTVNVDSLIVEKLLFSGLNQEGYASNRIVVPNVVTDAPTSFVSSVTLTGRGSNYSMVPTVAFTGGGGSGATGTVVLGYVIIDTLVTAPGSYASMPTASANLGTGATFALTMEAVGLTVASGGSGHSPGDILTINGGTTTGGTILQVGTVDGGGAVLTASITTPGSYTALPTNPASSTSEGSGIGATFNMLWGLLSIEVTAGGNDYTSASVLSFTGGGGTGGAAANLLLAPVGRIKVINITAGGTGYTTPPSVVFSGGGGGTGAAGTAVLSAVDIPVTMPVSVNIPVTTYEVFSSTNQPSVTSVTSKTTTGFNLTLTPLSGGSLSAGLMDIVIKWIGA
jgi:hypothetical protein